MSKPYYVKFETPTEIIEATFDALRQAKETGKIKKGTNETTKAIERGVAKIVLIAEDVEPPEVVAHLPILCEERNIPYLFAPTKDKIGEVLGVQLPTAAACIIEAGESQELLDQIIPKLKEQISTG